ncbi:MAG: CoA-binding protein [Promethearchaeota archaeon]
MKDNYLDEILNPESICVYGANNNLLGTMGSMQLRNLKSGFKGNIYPIHPKLEIIQGLKAYKSVLDLPETPTLALIILPPHVVPQVLEECGEKGIKRAIIVSGGFRESRDQNGLELTRALDNTAKKYKIRFIGPNCLGVYNGWYGSEDNTQYLMTFWPYFIPDLGKISIISQSGTIAAQTFWHAKNMGLKISKSISLGNEQNVDMVDLLRYAKDDSQTDVIGLYIEEIKRGKEFIELTREITPDKPIVAIYGGGTKAATRSIQSHTGAMAGNAKIFEGVFKETGIIFTDSILEFFYYLRTLSYAKKYNIFPKGKRIGIITESGGSATLMTKKCELLGLEVPVFSKKLQEQIAEYIPSTGSGKNPVDITFFKNFYEFMVTLPKTILKSGEVDGILFDGIFDFGEILEVIEKAGGAIDENMRKMISLFYTTFMKPLHRLAIKNSIPLFYSGPQLYYYNIYREFLKHDIPIFELWDYQPRCMSILVKYSDYRRSRNKN